MVFDSIENAKYYYGLGKGIETALKYFESFDPADYVNERVYLDGENVFVNRPIYETAPNPAPLFEAHREYIDVMFVVEGEEKFYVKPVERLAHITQQYDPKGDALLARLEDDAAAFRFPKGYFCIFMPQDAHCPAQMWDKPVQVKKMIAKVKMSAL